MSGLRRRALKKIVASEIKDLTLDLIRIPSETGFEEEASKFYADYLEKAGLEVKVDRLWNVIARISGANEGPSLMLNGHVDTIPIGKCVKPKFDGNRIHGRGALDMKGSLAATAQVAKSIVESGIRLKGDLWIASVTRHEVATTWPDKTTPNPGEGARAVVQAVSKRDIDVDAVLIAEIVSDHNIVVAHKGLAVVDFYIFSASPSQHTESVPIAQNPIVWLAELIRELVSCNKELSRRDVHPLTGSPSISFGIVSGGDYFNRVPAFCKVTGTMRYDPGETLEDTAREVKLIMKDLEMRSGLKLSLKTNAVKPAFEVSSGERIVRLLQRNVKSITGKNSRAIGTSVAGDAGIFCNEGGIPTVYFGPPEACNMAHSDKEFVHLRNLMTQAKIVAGTSLDFCGIAS